MAIYGSCLIYAEIVGHISHSDLTNNSPYFLGFVLFLFSLFVTFTRYGVQAEHMQMGFVIRELGSSLLTTVVGLPFRQWLFAYDPAQQDQDAFYRTLEEELRRSAGEFKKSQIELVGLVEQFVEVRKTLFEQEQTAAEQYVSNLRRAVLIFEDSFGGYPQLIASSLEACTKMFDKLKARMQKLSEVVEQFDSSQLKNAETELQKFTEQAIVLRQSLDALSESVTGLTSQAGAIPGVVSQAYGAFAETAGQGAAQLRANLGILLSDLGNLDRLLTEFVDIQTKAIGRAG